MEMDHSQVFVVQFPAMSSDVTAKCPYRFVFHKFHLKTGDFSSQGTDLLACLILIHHHFIFDVASTIGILKGIQSLHKISVRRAHTGNHNSLAINRGRAKQRRMLVGC